MNSSNTPSSDISFAFGVKPQTIGNRGLLTSKKVMNGFCRYMSQIERDFYLLLNHAPEIRTFKPQPFKLNYKDINGKLHSYYPDTFVENFLCEIKDNNTFNTILNLKHSSKSDFSKKEKKLFLNIEKWKAGVNYCNDKNLQFLVITDLEIRTPRFYNIWFTLGSSKADNSNYMNDLFDCVTTQGVKFNDLVLILSEKCKVGFSKASQIICYAIYHGYVMTNEFETKLLHENTYIRRKNQEKNNPFNPLFDLIIPRIRNRDLDSNIIDSDISSTSQNPIERYIPSQTAIEKKTAIDEWDCTPPYIRNSNVPDALGLTWKQTFFEKHQISRSTLFEWKKKFKNGGLSSLEQAHHKKGKTSKYSQVEIDLFEFAYNYWKKAGINIRAAWVCLTDEWIKLEEKGKINNRIPTYEAFRQYIRKNISYEELMRKRYGQNNGKEHPSLRSFTGAILPMQILQIDNSDFDVFVSHPKLRESIGIPYITAAIDCYSKMITGFELSLNPPNSQSALDTLVQSIIPKERYVEMYQTEVEWPIEGFPNLILVDNGLDFRAKDLEEFCKKYDIIIEFAPIKTPQYKAIIESWFNTLKKGLTQEDVVGIRPSLIQRLENRDLKPEAEAASTIQELNQWLYSWIIDTYHLQNKRDNLVLAPLLAYKKAISENCEIFLPLPREPPLSLHDQEEMKIYALHQFTRKVDKEGIVWQYIQYNNKELFELFKLLSQQKRKIGYESSPSEKTNRTVTVYQDRRDVRTVWVKNPLTDKIIVVSATNNWLRVIIDINGDLPVHASAWIKDVRSIKESNHEKITAYKYSMRKARQKRIEIQLGAKKQKGKTKRKLRNEARRHENKSKVISDLKWIDKGEQDVFHESEEEDDVWMDEEEADKIPTVPVGGARRV